MLASGERARFDALAPELAKMTGKVVYLGPDPSRAAGFKLLGNLFLMSVTAGMSDMLALAKSLQIAPNEAGSLFDWFNPGATAGARLNRIIEADFSHPSWELAMARKDARLMMEEAERGGLSLAVIPAIAKEMDRWIEKGHGKDDWTVIAKAGIP
jgi:3-hydroxyisobutyrate dehydrogenase